MKLRSLTTALLDAIDVLPYLLPGAIVGGLVVAGVGHGLWTTPLGASAYTTAWQLLNAVGLAS